MREPQSPLVLYGQLLGGCRERLGLAKPAAHPSIGDQCASQNPAASRIKKREAIPLPVFRISIDEETYGKPAVEVEVVVGPVTPLLLLFNVNVRPPITTPKPSKIKKAFGPREAASFAPAGLPAGSPETDCGAAYALDTTRVVARIVAITVRILVSKLPITIELRDFYCTDLASQP